MGENPNLLEVSEPLDFLKQRIEITFGSDEKMKMYYLQMSNHMRSPHKYYSKESEYAGLTRLCKRLKQYCGFIQMLGEHKWDKGTAVIQKTLGNYLMQNNIDAKERRQSNDEMAKQLEFMVFMAENTNLVKQLQGILTNHISDVTYLLKSMSASATDE